MKGKTRNSGWNSGIETHLVTIAFWVVGLVALFQMMPAAAFLRQRRWGSALEGDRHVS
jgi:uncharacterized membrane protein YuzA (DUF378 family)